MRPHKTHHGRPVSVMTEDEARTWLGNHGWQKATAPGICGFCNRVYDAGTMVFGESVSFGPRAECCSGVWPS